jgi:hypothetical protein
MAELESGTLKSKVSPRADLQDETKVDVNNVTLEHSGRHRIDRKQLHMDASGQSLHADGFHQYALCNITQDIVRKPDTYNAIFFNHLLHHARKQAVAVAQGRGPSTC